MSSIGFDVRPTKGCSLLFCALEFLDPTFQEIRIVLFPSYRLRDLKPTQPTVELVWHYAFEIGILTLSTIVFHVPTLSSNGFEIHPVKGFIFVYMVLKLGLLISDLSCCSHPTAQGI